MLTPVIVPYSGHVIYMVEIKISEKTIKFKSYSSKSHLKTSNLIPLEKLEIDTSGKLTRWYFNNEYKSGTHYLQALCPGM
jgi:hypothetical protein